MVGRKYQWLIMGTYGERWWLDETAPCSTEQLQAALEGCILTDLLPLATSGEITVSGIVSKTINMISYGIKILLAIIHKIKHNKKRSKCFDNTQEINMLVYFELFKI